MSNESKIQYSGLGLFTTWTLILIILKYYGLIATTWLWVFAPLWMSIGIGLIVVGMVLLIMALVAVIVEVFK